MLKLIFNTYWNLILFKLFTISLGQEDGTGITQKLSSKIVSDCVNVLRNAGAHAKLRGENW